MKALELAKRSKQFANEGQLIHLCSSDEVCNILAADAAELCRLAEVNAALRVALSKSAELLDERDELLSIVQKFDRAARRSSDTVEFSVMCDSFVLEARELIAKCTAKE